MKITIQEGLQQEVIIGRYTSYSILTSEEGYCFYEKTNPTYDEEGKEIETPIQYMNGAKNTFFSHPDFTVG